jgi:esterase/lipase
VKLDQGDKEVFKNILGHEKSIWSPKASNWLWYNKWEEMALKGASSLKTPQLVVTGNTDYFTNDKSVIQFVDHVPFGSEKKLKVYPHFGHLFYCLEGYYQIFVDDTIKWLARHMPKPISNQ